MEIEPASSLNAGRHLQHLVAHRAGNRLADLREAERHGAALVEADVRLFRGRLEVRHLKTLGPLPIFWDRWELAAPWRRHLQLAGLLAAVGADTELVLDLKGRNGRVAARVLELIEPFLDRRRFTICARRWRLLDAFDGYPVRRMQSVGSPRQLRRLLDRFAGARLDGVSVHERLVDAESIASLRAIADVVFTWPVNRPERARELLRLGVTGLITDDFERLAPVPAA